MSTHNTREEIEEIVDDFITRFSVNIADVKTTKELAKYWIRKTLLKLNETHHQELQKARHDWLREEIVKLYEAKKDLSKIEFPSEEYARAYEKNKALQTIIDRYQSELDQPTV